MSTLTATEVMARIEREAESNTAELRMVRTMQPGQIVRQGDIYLELLPEPVGGGKPYEGHQLAPGSTKGSRHIIEGDGLTLTQPWTGPLDGPQVEANQRFTVTHPEHAHVSLPSGCYRVTYQRDWEAEELRRVAD